MDKEFAESFSEHWIASWNAHDLDEILSHYTDDFELSSPIICERMGVPEGILRGKKAVSEYWAIGLASKHRLHFEFIDTLVGVNSLVILYKGRKGLSSEVFYFNDERKVYKAVAHYE